MYRSVAAVVFVAVFASAGLAQENAVVSSLKGVHELPKGFIMRTAEMLSQELYDFRPTDEVRTAGQILAHIADAQYLFCSGAAGEESPSEESVEQTRSEKADIIAALEESFAYCDGIYDGLSDAQGAEMIEFFGAQRTRVAALAMNTAHNYEHYGNLVTYMRLNGITPPSSM